MLELIYAARQNYTESPEFKAQDAEIMKKAFLGFCLEGIKGYYNAFTDKLYVLDKSRGHIANYGFIDSFYPNPKMICLVRALPDILASMEKMIRKNPHKSTPIINPVNMQGTSLFKRVNLFLSNPPIGLALDRLSDAIASGIADKILLIRYEDLCLYPEQQMKRVYEYLEISAYKHEFTSIPQTTKEDDEVYGISGLHTIRPSLEMKPSDAIQILGKDVYDWINNQYKWYNDYFGYK